MPQVSGLGFQGLEFRFRVVQSFRAFLVLGFGVSDLGFQGLGFFPRSEELG